MTAVREETFGPVSPIITFGSINEAIQITNGTAFGLSSSICTNRMDDAMHFAHAARLLRGQFYLRATCSTSMHFEPTMKKTRNSGPFLGGVAVNRLIRRHVIEY